MTTRPRNSKHVTQSGGAAAALHKEIAMEQHVKIVVWVLFNPESQSLFT
ncbi:MAG TPA: hypothetical protein VMU84_16630 [Thermoanaerobaculia bacterium]|nr:hypothetical protein [Thermoanaerobaculia bacterium]